MLFTNIFNKCENLICKIGILFGLFIFLFISINIMMSIYTYINMRIRSGSFIEGFEVKSYNSESMLSKNKIYDKVYSILSEKNCLAKTTNNLANYDKYDIERNNINDCPTVNAQTPFVGILQTSYNSDNDINFYK